MLLAEELATGDPVVQIVSLVVLVVVGIISELTRRRARKVDTTVGDTPAIGEDTSTVAEHVASTDQKLDLLMDRVSDQADLAKANKSLLATRFDHIDAVLAERGRQLEELKADHGQRLGDLERRVVVVETRLDSCPATATPTAGG